MYNLAYLLLEISLQLFFFSFLLSSFCCFLVCHYVVIVVCVVGFSLTLFRGYFSWVLELIHQQTPQCWRFLFFFSLESERHKSLLVSWTLLSILAYLNNICMVSILPLISYSTCLFFKLLRTVPSAQTIIRISVTMTASLL